MKGCGSASRWCRPTAPRSSSERATARCARTVAASALQSIVEQHRSPRLVPGFQYERQPGLAGLAPRGPQRLDVIFDDWYAPDSSLPHLLTFQGK